MWTPSWGFWLRHGVGRFCHRTAATATATADGDGNG